MPTKRKATTKRKAKSPLENRLDKIETDIRTALLMGAECRDRLDMQGSDIGDMVNLESKRTTDNLEGMALMARKVAELHDRVRSIDCLMVSNATTHRNEIVELRCTITKVMGQIEALRLSLQTTVPKPPTKRSWFTRLKEWVG